MALTQYFPSAIIWACMFPVCLISIIYWILAIVHFRQIYRTLDLWFISLLSSFLVNTLLFMVILFVVIFHPLIWTVDLCKFFIWCYSSMQLVQIISMVSISIDGVIMLRTKGKRRIYGIVQSKSPAIIIGAIWLVSCLLCVLPLVGWTNVVFVANNNCRMLPYESGVILGSFTAVIEFISIVVSIICLVDSHMNVKDAATSTSYQYHKPKVMEGLNGALGTSSYRENVRSATILNALDFADNARDMFWAAYTVVLSVILFNTFPVMIVNILGTINPEFMTSVIGLTVTVWFMVLEGCIVPNVLWLSSKRYRHAGTYNIKVLTGKSKSYDDEVCRIQLYHKRLLLTYPPTQNGSVAPSVLSSYQKQEDLRYYNTRLDGSNNSIHRNGKPPSIYDSITLPRPTSRVESRHSGIENEGYDDVDFIQREMQPTANAPPEFDFHSEPRSDSSEEIRPGVLIKPDKDGTVRSRITRPPLTGDEFDDIPSIPQSGRDVINSEVIDDITSEAYLSEKDKTDSGSDANIEVMSAGYSVPSSHSEEPDWQSADTTLSMMEDMMGTIPKNDLSPKRKQRDYRETAYL